MTAENVNTTDSAAPKARPGMLLVKAYLVLYALIFVGYIIFKLQGYSEVKGMEFVQKAFTLGENPGSPSREELAAAFNDKTGHVIMWEDVTFRLGDIEYRLVADTKMTKDEAIAYAMYALSAKDKKDAEVKPLYINKTSFTGYSWAYFMTVYNIFGMVMLIVVFLKDPLNNFLAQQAKDSAEALKTAREAKSEAEKIKAQYEAMIKEVEEEKRRMESTAKEELEEEREHIINTAKHEAAALLETLKSNLDTEVQSARAKLRAEIAEEAIKLARDMIAENARGSDHEKAVDSFIEDLKKVKL